MFWINFLFKLFFVFVLYVFDFCFILMIMIMMGSYIYIILSSFGKVFLIIERYNRKLCKLDGINWYEFN